MKKIIILIISLIIPAIISGSVLAQGPPQPPPINSDNYYFEGSIKWGLNGDTLTNEVVTRERGTGTILTPALQVGYRYAVTGKLLEYPENYVPPAISEPGAPLPNPPEPTTFEGVRLYSLSRETNNAAFRTFPYDSIYYAEVYQGKIVDIIYADNNGHMVLESQNGSKRNYSRTKAPNIPESESSNLWVTRYLNAEVPMIRSQKPSPGTGIGRGDCESEMKRLVNDINSFRGALYTFALNGCKDNTADKCRSWHLYFRGKSAGETIGDNMKPYQEAFKQMKGLDMPGFIIALMGEYEVENLVFEPAGIAMLDQLGTQAKSVEDTAAYLESSCSDFIKKTTTYPRYLRKYDPNATTQQTINNWEEMKKVVNEVSAFAALAKQNPTSTVSGPLSESGWLNKVIKQVACLLRNFFIGVFHWLANFAAFFLRRNY